MSDLGDMVAIEAGKFALKAALVVVVVGFLLGAWLV